MQAAKVLVTGATGLLGANIVEQLNSRGYDVRVFARKTSQFDALAGLTYEVFVGDLNSEKDLTSALQGCEYVIHAAALTALSTASYQTFYKTNVEATKLLADLAQRFDVKRFIYVSTANCFTNGTLENPGDETGGFMPWLKKSNYAYTKYLAQQYVLEKTALGLPAIVVAPTFLIGPRDTKPSSGRLIEYILRNKIVFYPAGGKSFIDVRFAAQAIVNVLEQGRVGEIYLLAGENLSYKQFYSLVAQTANVQRIKLGIPRVALLGIGYFADVLKILGFKMAFDRTAARLLTLDNYFSNKKAQNELSLIASDTEQAIRAYLQWREESLTRNSRK